MRNIFWNIIIVVMLALSEIAVFVWAWGPVPQLQSVSQGAYVKMGPCVWKIDGSATRD